MSAAEVDALISGCAPAVPAPDGRRGSAVLVTGPWLAGNTSLVAALRTRMPGVVVVEPADLPAGELPAIVVFVVSAAAPLAPSDCAWLDAAAARTDAVIGVVTKIDAHRRWRAVLDTNRAALQRHDVRYAQMPWVGAAAAPPLGDPQLDALVELLDDMLADPALPHRNRLREWESQLDAVRSRYDDAADDRAIRAQRLRQRREELLRDRRLDRSERSIALRSQVQQARVQLSYFGRSRCASVLSELQEDAAVMTRRRLAAFEPYVRRRVTEVVGEVNDGVTEHFADVAHELGLPPVPVQTAPPAPEVTSPPLRSRRLETRLVTLLGAGFGLGVALTLSRLFADMAPGLAVLGAVACALVGLAVTVWVVSMRGVLQDRAVLDRWVGEVMSGTRAAVDQLVATRVLAAESSLTSALVDDEESARELVAERIAEIDARLRQEALARTQAAAVRDREMPAVSRALELVRADLNKASEKPDEFTKSTGPQAEKRQLNR
ncbi:MAG: hypothetical protein ABWY45_11380 [Mycobacterium sp.]